LRRVDYHSLMPRLYQLDCWVIVNTGCAKLGGFQRATLRGVDWWSEVDWLGELRCRYTCSIALKPHFRIATGSRRGVRASWQPQDTAWDKDCSLMVVSSSVLNSSLFWVAHRSTDPPTLSTDVGLLGAKPRARHRVEIPRGRGKERQVDSRTHKSVRSNFRSKSDGLGEKHSIRKSLLGGEGPADGCLEGWL
jgi:hypothetical protein